MTTVAKRIGLHLCFHLFIGASYVIHPPTMFCWRLLVCAQMISSRADCPAFCSEWIPIHLIRNGVVLIVYFYTRHWKYIRKLSKAGYFTQGAHMPPAATGQDMCYVPQRAMLSTGKAECHYSDARNCHLHDHPVTKCVDPTNRLPYMETNLLSSSLIDFPS